jgi:hypothetical protein
MSIDHTVYIGPYVECTDTIINHPEDFRTCINEKCPNYNEQAKPSPYCPECGHHIKSATQIRQAKKTDVHHICQKINEVLAPIENYDLNNCYWVCNKENPTFYNYDPRRSDGLALTYDEEYGFKIEKGSKSGILSPNDGLELFKSMHKIELDVLIEAYGEENVQIMWGILNWVS